MSLILEALRKSEAERRRGEMPDLRAELPPSAAARRTPSRAWPWIAALATVAIVVAALLALHPWSRESASTTATAKQPATTTPETSLPAESVRLQPRSQAPIASPPAPRVAETTATQAMPPAETEIPADSPEPADVATVPDTPPPAPSASSDAETPVNALPADLRKALPPLQLSMHVWDPDPAKRFVILDGERHVEGDSVGPMRIRRIDAGGVLFDWQGRGVRLPLR